MKMRVLGGVVTPGSPMYMYNSALSADDIEFHAAAVTVGLLVGAAGATTAAAVSDTAGGSRGDGTMHYTIFEVFVDSKFVVLQERMTEEAARCVVEAAGAAGGRVYCGLVGGGAMPRRVRERVVGGITD